MVRQWWEGEGVLELSNIPRRGGSMIKRVVSPPPSDIDSEPFGGRVFEKDKGGRRGGIYKMIHMKV